METPFSTGHDEDADLTARLRQGEKEAVQDLYLRYVDRVYSFVFNQVDRNKAAAEDIVQETFLAALKSVSRYRGQSKPYTWLCAIAYHKIGDFYRRQGREPEGVRLSPAAREPEKIPDREVPTVTTIESEETKQVVEQAMSRLPLRYRQVLMFKYVEEMPVSDVSVIMQRSPKSVEGLLTRARKALRASLADLSEGQR